jgi:hypothetical protein
LRAPSSIARPDLGFFRLRRVIPSVTLGDLDLEFSRSEARLDKLLATHDPDLLNRVPGPERWSALQCIEHLTLANRVNSAALAAALRERPKIHATNDTIHPGWLWTFLLKLVEPSTRLKGFAPRVLRPPSHLDPVETRNRFEESHDTLRRLMKECHGFDVNRLRFPHPVIRLHISAGVTFWLLALHEARHLQQAERALDLGKRTIHS